MTWIFCIIRILKQQLVGKAVIYNDIAFFQTILPTQSY